MQIAALRSSLVALKLKFKECEKIHADWEEVVLDETEDAAELNAFFNEVDEVTFINRGKMNQLHFLVFFLINQ